MDALTERVNQLYTPEQQEAELRKMGSLIPEMLMFAEELCSLAESNNSQAGDNPENLPISA